MICVFDIETIPDFHLLSRVYGYEGLPLEIAKEAFKAQYEKSGSEFLSPCFHRVISISSVICDEYGRFKKVGHFGGGFLDEVSAYVGANGVDSKNCESTRDSKQRQNFIDDNGKIDFESETFLDSLEKQLISEFWQFFNKSNPRLVSFNGRGFDIPTLLLRAMRYDINAFAYYEQDNHALNKNKWQNYRQRYSEEFHTDLLDSLGSFGAMRTLSLNNLCAMLGLVGKYDMNGSQVFETYLCSDEVFKEEIEQEHSSADSNVIRESKIKALMRINHYCHSDVLNTYWLYLKYELLKGSITEADYYDMLQVFYENLPQDKPYWAIFAETLQGHIRAYTSRNLSKG